MIILENFFSSPIYQQFLDHLKKKYIDEFDTFTCADIQDKLEVILNMGLMQSKKFLKEKRSCHLLYNGHPARADMMNRLGNILYALQRVESYPVVPPLRLGDAIKKVIGPDKRYRRRYMDWILTLSNYQAVFNKVDMTVLVGVFPEELIVGKEW